MIQTPMPKLAEVREPSFTSFALPWRPRDTEKGGMRLSQSQSSLHLAEEGGA